MRSPFTRKVRKNYTGYCSWREATTNLKGKPTTTTLQRYYLERIRLVAYVCPLQFVKTTNLKLIQVPHFKGLRVPDIIAFVKTKIEIEEYLPSFKDKDKMPDRAWIWNIGSTLIYISLVNTLVPLDFKVYIKERMNENNMVRMVKRREEIEVIPEIQKLFKDSETISSMICCIKLEQDKMEGSVHCFKKKQKAKKKRFWGGN